VLSSKAGRDFEYKLHSGSRVAHAVENSNAADNGGTRRIKRKAFCDRFSLWSGPFQAFRA